MIDKRLFLEKMREMEHAFEKGEIPDRTAKVYYERLKGMSNQDWSRAVEQAIKTLDRFPSIAQLLRAEKESRDPFHGAI